MKKLFVHHPLFRLLSPVFSGIIIYLLILMIYNNVAQLQNEFLGEELYVCIGLSYVIQEFSRLLLLLFKKLPTFSFGFFQLFLQVVLSMFLSVVLVTILIIVYYKNMLGFSPNTEELWVFNSVCSIVTLIYVLLYTSHQYLYKINSEKLQQEERIKQHIEEDFIQFTKEINPALLFESFEALLLLIDEDIDKTDEYIETLAAIYRYILSKKDTQLIDISEEIDVLKILIKLFDYLPYRTISLEVDNTTSFLIVPGTLLVVLEKIMRTTIVSSKVKLHILIEESEGSLFVKYEFNDRILEKLELKNLADIEKVYAVYSVSKLSVREEELYRVIQLPKLKMNL